MGNFQVYTTFNVSLGQNEPIIAYYSWHYSLVFAFHRCRIGHRIVILKLFSIDIHSHIIGWAWASPT